MSLLNTLRALGGRLRLIQAAPGAPAAPKKIATRQVTLAELTSEVRADEIRALAETPAELSVPYAGIFEAAGLKPPPHGWTVERLQQLLGTDQYKAMDRKAVQQAVLGLLSAEKTDVEEIVRDAVARDQALDAFEAFTRTKMQDRQAGRERRIAELHDQIRQAQEQIARLDEEAKADREQWRQWRARKTDYEKAMAGAVGYLLDKPVVSIDESEVTGQNGL